MAALIGYSVRPGQSGGHGTAGEHATDPEQSPGNITCQRPKGGFDNTVDSAAGWDPAAALRKANCHRPNGKPTSEKGDRRIRTNARGKSRRHGKDAGADDHTNNTGCERPRSYCADQSDIALVFSHERYDSTGLRIGLAGP
jgi:hypothetical protein